MADWRKRIAAGGIDAWTLFLFGFGIPTGSATLNILWPFILVIGTRRMLEAGVRRVLLQPIVATGFALLAWMVVGVLYSPESPFHAFLTGVGPYKKIVLVPFIAAIVLARPHAARWALHGFMAAMALTFLLSWPSLWQGESWHRSGEAGGTIFKLHITQNLLMSFAAWVTWRWAETKEGRLLWAGRIAALLLVVNVLMVPGRTGWLAILVLALFWMPFKLRGWRLVAALFALPLIAVAVFETGGQFARRTSEIVNELEDYQHGKIEYSIGLRTEFYRNTIVMIAKRPAFGLGSGAFENAYRQETGLSGRRAPPHPHSEYLMVWVEHGVVGLALLAVLAYWLVVGSRRLPQLEREIAWGALIIIGSGALFNTLLRDSSEGHAFALLAGSIAAGAIRVRPAGAFRTGERSPPSG